jgi:poly(A) polymerase
VNAKLDPSAHAWMTDARTRAVIAALTEHGGAARFVGGAVRNALIGEAVGDVDIATPLVPDEVMRRLQGARLGAVPTGIEHGTITAVSGGKPFEITTLRRDVETFGRRALVAYTTDWAEDAARRDFTMNALYAAEDGTIFDYVGGLDDLTARRVCFVGDATTRIREDYLRILRLFRFHAWYGRGELDEEALAAATAEKAGMKLLSGERVQKELLRLLEAQDPSPTLATMGRAEILAQILPVGFRLPRLQRLVMVERGNALPADAVLRLAALIPDGVPPALKIAEALKLSNAARDRLVQAGEKDERIAAALTPAEARQLIYRLGAACFLDQLLLQWAASRARANDAAWRALLALAMNWKPPVFALSGNDVMAEGIEAGPKIGAVLREVERWWVEQDFAPDRSALLSRLKEAARPPRA